MINEKLQDLLGNQYLIVRFMGKKLSIVNYIIDGYNNNKPILKNNRFLHFTAHTYYRSLFIDFYAIYGPNTSYNVNSFYKIRKDYSPCLEPAVVTAIQTQLNAVKQEIEIIKKVRNSQIAHYDFKCSTSIDLNFDNLPVFNKLYALAKEIIEQSGRGVIDKELQTEYDFSRRNDKIDSLERLLARGS